MKHKEITHRTVEMLMFWAGLVFFPLLSGFCFAAGMPAYVSILMLCIPVVLAAFTFVPFLQGAPQSYAAVTCMEAAATVYGIAGHSLSTMHGVFFAIMCFAALYRRIGLTVSQIVYVTILYATLYLLFPGEFFAHMNTPLSAVARLIFFYMGCASVILMISWFRNAVAIMESRAQSITDLYKMVEKEKRKAEAGTKEKADFLANMSHEMRTPMIAVCGMSELLLQNNLTPLEEEYVTTIQNSANNMLNMVNDILDFSKIEANMMELVEAPYNIESLIAEVANIINVRIGEKDIAFVVEIAPDIPATLIGDEARIRQILINLLNNAVKFTDSGFIRLRIRYETDENNRCWVSAEITDTGIGITVENQKRLFSQFTQLDSDRTRQLEGTGLGLVISQRLANKMNGSIHVKSEYGKGSQFTVVIEQRPGSRSELGVVPDPDGYVAYVYEPNPVYEENIKTLLEKLGVAVIPVGDIALWDYYNADRYGVMLFFDYASAIANVNSFAPQIKRMRLVSIIDRNTFVDSGIKDNILMIHKPILTAQLAALIRGENLDNFRRRKKFENHLFIPDAKILVVDDNYVNLRVTAGLLGTYKPQVEMVSSGQEAYELLKTNKSFDLIFMDHMMPVWDGIETVQHIRALNDPYYKTVPIVALSAVSQSSRDLFLSKGMDDFVEKPVSTDTLAAVLKKFIPKEKQQSEYAEKVDPMMTTNRSREEYIAAAAKTSGKDIAIVGLDTGRGIFNMGGSVDAYHHILNVVLDDGRKKLIYLEKYAEEENCKAYHLEAHSLKSVAASIGAMELSELAKQHEQASRSGDTAFVRQNYRALVEQYTAMLQNIEQYLTANHLLHADGDDVFAEEAVSQPISHQKKHNDVVEIIRLIERFDSDAALDSIHELLKYHLDKKDRELLKKAIHQLSDYMFDEAIQTLSAL